MADASMSCKGCHAGIRLHLAVGLVAFFVERSGSTPPCMKQTDALLSDGGVVEWVCPICTRKGRAIIDFSVQSPPALEGAS